MLIPVKCYSCGKVLANKYVYFQTQLEIKKKELKQNSINNINDNNDNNDNNDPLFININATIVKKTIAGEIMDDLGLIRICCRKTLLTSIGTFSTVNLKILDIKFILNFIIKLIFNFLDYHLIII
jgi:DNA-directed RNA polymerase I, II, and III subunit RPABC5